jgi:hypothetical protein
VPVLAATLTSATFDMTIGLSERLIETLRKDIVNTRVICRYRTHKTVRDKVERWERVLVALEKAEITGSDIVDFNDVRLKMQARSVISAHRRAQWVQDIDYLESAILLAAARKIIT